MNLHFLTLSRENKKVLCEFTVAPIGSVTMSKGRRALIQGFVYSPPFASRSFKQLTGNFTTLPPPRFESAFRRLAYIRIDLLAIIRLRSAQMFKLKYEEKYSAAKNQ